MDLALIATAAGIIIALLTAILVQQYRTTNMLSKLEGKYETHREGCDNRFKNLEERLDKGGL